MTTEFTDLSAVMLGWMATYLVHSTLLLVAAWLAARIVGRRSFALQDQVWKLAMVLPLLTATIQQAAGPSSLAIARWTLAWPVGQTDSTDLPVRVARADQRDERGLHWETTVSEISREQPIASRILEPDVSPSTRDPDVPGTATASTTDANWTIDIQPGPATDAHPPPYEIADLATTEQIATETDEEIRSGGDKGTHLAEQPLPSVLSSSPPPPDSSSREFPLLTIAGALFGLHLACAALRLLSLAWRERRRLAATISGADGPARVALDQILASRRIRRPVRVLYGRSVRSPAACGWWRWRIVLPAGLDHEMPSDELRALLAHELAHLVRRDTVWLWWSHALCILLPVQPLNLVARRRWEEAAEYLCDAWAVEADVRPLTMAKCLTRVADRYVGNAAPMGLTAVGSQSTLSRRIERLTAGVIVGRQGRVSRAVVVLLACSVGAAAVIAAPQVSLRGERRSFPEPANESESVVPSDNLAPSDEEMRERGDEGLESTRAVDSREELRRELQALLADLDRVNELLAGVDDSPELAAAREQLQQRLERIRDRGLGAIDESDPDAGSVRPTAEPVSNE
jgi:beta-lactamase regulating signal transducer with metallopeptidase domain